MKQLAIVLLLSTALLAGDAPAPTCVSPPENELKIVKYVEPEFPKGAVTHGTVMLAGVVDETGHLRNLDVLEGHPFLAEPILEAASQWIVQTYCPEGKPAKAVVVLTTTWQRNQPQTEIRVDTEAGKSKKKKHH